jgi:hypothetical protein
MADTLGCSLVTALRDICTARAELADAQRQVVAEAQQVGAP